MIIQISTENKVLPVIGTLGKRYDDRYFANACILYYIVVTVAHRVIEKQTKYVE